MDNAAMRIKSDDVLYDRKEEPSRTAARVSIYDFFHVVMLCQPLGTFVDKGQDEAASFHISQAHLVKW